MEFFNRKQEVMDVQMTQYGKYLLSKGQFKPEFYAFYDDDITYDWDNASTGTSAGENQNDIEDRIKETPRMKTQYVFSGIETNIKEINEMVLVKQQAKLGGVKIQPTAEKNYSLAYPLGNSTFENEYLPAWSIDYLAGNLLTASQNLEIYANKKLDGSGNPTVIRNLPIPQLTSDFDYENDIVVGYDGEVPYVEVIDEETDLFVLEIGENNTVFQKGNFDIEVFRIQDNFDLDGNKTGEETLIPLSFSVQQQALYDFDNQIEFGEAEDIPDIEELDPTYVEHYFHILVDKEINPDTLCLVKPVDKSQGVFSDRVEVCSPTTGKVPLNIYDDMAEDPGEPC